MKVKLVTWNLKTGLRLKLHAGGALCQFTYVQNTGCDILANHGNLHLSAIILPLDS
jgi:hypothetical protein